MNYFSSKPEEKRESPSMKVRRDISLPSSQNIKLRQFVNIQNNVLGQKIPEFSKKL